MEDAWCALSTEKEQKQAELLWQRVTFEKQMTTEKQHLQRELAATWAASDKKRKQLTTIKI